MTDMTMLRAVLRHERKLTAGQAKAFKAMLDDLERGQQVSLSKAQRAWVFQKFQDLDLEGKELPPAVKPKGTGKVPTFEWEKNLPLKPPGRK